MMTGKDMIKVCEMPIDGIFVMQPQIVDEKYGFTQITYDQSFLQSLGIKENFVQENQSKSKRNVLRGMHFQQQYAQSQIVRVLEGSVYDVVVDIRKNSSTFGNYFGIYLSDTNRKMVYMAEGFAHGFYCVSESVTMHYKCSQFYHPEDEAGIRFDDKMVGISWPVTNQENLIISEKDASYPTLQEYMRMHGIKVGEAGIYGSNL